MMKNILPFLMILFMPFVSLSQVTQVGTSPGAEQQSLMIQGLGDESIMLSAPNPLRVKTFAIEDNKKLEYVEKGDPSGTPVIFLHGLTDSWHSFEKILPLLPESYHAFAITQRGHGNSDKSFTSYHPKDFANDVAAFVNKLQLGPVVIVGHSMGGVVGQQFAIDFPRLLKSLVIVSSDAAFTNNPGLPEFYAEVTTLKDPIDISFMDAFQRSTLAKPIEQAFLDTLVVESLKVPAAIFKSAFKGILETELVPHLREINRPVLIFWGDKDSICQQAGQYAMRNHISGAKLIIYQGTGHALHWEEPHRFVQDLHQFLNTLN